MGTRSSTFAVRVLTAGSCVFALWGGVLLAAPADAAQKDLTRIRADLEATRWPATRTGLDAFAKAHPEASPAQRQELETLRADFVRTRAEHFRAYVGDRFAVLASSRVEARVERPGATFTSMEAWVGGVSGSLMRETLEALLGEMRLQDPAVTLDELNGFWAHRPRTEATWKPACYGSGAYLFVPGEKGPSASEWWKAASVAQRAQAWFARFVETCGRFEVVAQPLQRPCTKCMGDGTIQFTLSNGLTTLVLCPQCRGARGRYDRILRYR